MKRDWQSWDRLRNRNYQGVPIAFTNNVTPGSIGIIGASGTGIQELTTIITVLGRR
ncbi:MAG: hypothetical protein ACLVJO_12295 [[Clostridium] scindens]